MFVAERRGFEPLKPFWGLLAFQAGQFNHSCISPDCGDKSNNYFLKLPHVVGEKCAFLSLRRV